MGEMTETLVAEPEDAGARVDKWLAESLQELDYEVSRSQIQQWLDNGYVTSTTGRKRLKASDSVSSGERFDIRVPAPDPVELVADDIPIEIVFEDADVVVVNKPRGLVVHPAAGHERGTLLNALIARGVTLSSLGGQLRPGVVHRIDKDTSGLVMFAKSDTAYYALTEQLRLHQTERIYLALVHGRIGHETGLIDAPIGRDPQNRQRMAIRDNGKHAITHFTVLERFKAYSYVRLQLETGRTHQIRVHMAYIEHPLAGDPVYGRRNTLPIDGQALHAATLGFVHPVTREALRFEAPIAEDILSLLEELRRTED